jgi:hypothetical protein
MVALEWFSKPPPNRTVATMKAQRASVLMTRELSRLLPNFFGIWSGRRESNPFPKLGKLETKL